MKLRPPGREAPEARQPQPAIEAIIGGGVAADDIATEDEAEEARAERSIKLLRILKWGVREVVLPDHPHLDQIQVRKTRNPEHQ